jgi:endonuclease/exonuclease/phosphatase (EEP) superfamily protein YafD
MPRSLTLARPDRPPFQIDWLFARGVRVLSCDVLNTPEDRAQTAALSDHSPVVGVFEVYAG